MVMLILDTGCPIDLKGCLYIGVSIGRIRQIGLDNLGFNVKFGHGGFSLYRNDYIYGSDTLFDSLYRFNLDANGTLFNSLYKFNLDAKFSESLFNIESQDIKRSVSNKSFAFLWHQRLGHISKERMMRLVKNKILLELDFSDLDVCVDSI
ncbi:hypothetical protein V2J09_006668 [Rumex salicifolius]